MNVSVLEQKVLAYMQDNPLTDNWILGSIRFTMNCVRHLKFKDGKHKRNDQEIRVRYLCALHLVQLLEKVGLYQEHKSLVQDIAIKQGGKKVFVSKKVAYYGFIGIIVDGTTKRRIKVVVRHVEGWKFPEVLSVIPARNAKGYHRFDEQKN